MPRRRKKLDFVKDDEAFVVDKVLSINERQIPKEYVKVRDVAKERRNLACVGLEIYEDI